MQIGMWTGTLLVWTLVLVARQYKQWERGRLQRTQRAWIEEQLEVAHDLVEAANRKMQRAVEIYEEAETENGIVFSFTPGGEPN